MLIFTSDNGSPARDGSGQSGPIGSVIENYGHYANGDLRGFKGDIWEAVRLNVSSGDPNPVELYNLEKDVAETHDVSGQYPEIVREMLDIMNEAHTPNMLFPLFPDDGKLAGS